MPLNARRKIQLRFFSLMPKNINILRKYKHIYVLTSF